jgi:hypothetical protein
MSHITIAVALVGAAVAIGLAISHSQKGKTQGPAIIEIDTSPKDRGHP